MESLKKWQDRKFGLFIHWGPVSLRGTEIGWSRGVQVPVDEYDHLYKEFNPVLFDAKEWVSIAREAGMKYLVITSKHHDGFCLWPSNFTNYDIISTPFRKDILKELSDECKQQDIMFCTYYSIIDWHHPDYIPRGKGDPRPPENADFKNYKTYMNNQLNELITRYHPEVLWFDGYWEETWTQEDGMKMYVDLKNKEPGILINNRLDKSRQGKQGMSKSDNFAGDFGTPEQTIGNFNNEVPWESCITLGTQWAWKPNDNIKSYKECIHTLVQTAGGGGNLLLNVGPMPDGRIELRQIERLRTIGEWLDKNGESIYETKGGPYMPNKWFVSTYKNNKIYLHILNWFGNTLKLPPLTGKKIISGSILNGENVKITHTNRNLIINLPTEKRKKVDTIVVLELNNPASEIQPIPVKTIMEFINAK